MQDSKRWDTMKYRKKALIVTAYPTDIQCYITTLEGVSTANVGDYIVTGIDSEQWVVKPKWFHDAYTHIRGNSYQRKPQIVDAELTVEPDVVHAPTGDIKGDPGDYKITGKRGEHWFVKPDIFDKTYEKVGKSMETSGLQKSIDQIGLEAVSRYIPKGAKLHPCPIHGMFLAHYKDTTPTCNLCGLPTTEGNGTTASDIEHWIDLKDSVQAATGYRPQG